MNRERRMKGQSAIEYLTSYGWMLLVIAIVGGAIFTTVQNSSQIESTSGLANSDVQVEEFGVTDQGLTTEIRAASSDQVEDANISIVDEETGKEVYADKEVTIPVGGTESVSFPNTTSSENTNTYTVKVNYDTGGLQDLSAEGTLTGRIEFGESASDDTQNVDDGESNDGTNDGTDDGTGGSGSAVSVSGDSITALATTSTFGNSEADSGPICVGPECGETSGSETDNVSLSGDVMKGTLFVDNITDKSTTCFGEFCADETGSATGDLGVDSNTMNGTLNVTELKPDSAQQICAGTEC